MRYGFDYITSGNYAGDWQELFFPVDSVVTLTTNKGDSFSGVTFSKGQSIVGPYEGISVTSGAVIAYKRSDTERQYQGLLDIHQNAAAAYSLRKLRRAYSGAAIRVRESATSTEADIGFDSFGNLDTTALLAHTGANDGYVVTWYDQSGNARNATQATAAAQPQIVSSGSVILENGQSAIDFDGVDDCLNTSPFSSAITPPFSVFNVFKIDTNKVQVLAGLNDRFSLYAPANISNEIRYFASAYDGGIAEDTSQHLGFCKFNGASSEWAFDGVASAANLGTANATRISLGSAGTTNEFDADCKWQEYIFYFSDQSSNRTAIESNMNDFYSIYP